MGDSEPGPGGSDSSLASSSTGHGTVLPRLLSASQPAISLPSSRLAHGQAHGQAPGRVSPKTKTVTVIRRLPRESGPRYGSLDRKHSRA